MSEVLQCGKCGTLQTFLGGGHVGKCISCGDELCGSQSGEYTGGSVSYYQVQIQHPTSGGDPYIAECNDVIEALGMSYAEGNAFKALWRRAASRTLGLAKRGYTDGLYDAEKVEFFGKRLVVQETARKALAEGK